jgi:hypothetical protein
MAKLNLTGIDVRALVDAYRADLRQLEYKIAQIKNSIADLEKNSPKEEGEKAKGKPGPKPKADKAEIKADKPKGKPGRRPKAAEESVIVETPKAKGKPGPKPKAEKAEDKAEKAKSKPEVQKSKPGPKPKAVEAPVAVETPKAKGKPGPKTKTVKAEKTTTVKAEKTTTKAPKGKPGPKAKTVSAPKAPAKSADGERKKPGRVAKLNELEAFVFDKIKNAKEPVLSATLFKAMQDRRDKLKLSEGDAVLKQKLNQVLIKLTGRMKMVKKEAHEGRALKYSAN